MFHMNNNRITLLVLCVFLITPVSNAEERKYSQEYISARTEAVKELRSIYRSCTDKIGSDYNSEFFKKCINDPLARIRKERCGHEAQLATERFIINEGGYAPCKHLKPEIIDYKKRLKELVTERNIEIYE